jgi:quaternary ammonium compound-resistance protein SugE
MLYWLLLILAGIFEIGFTTFMKLSEGFTRWPYIIGFAVCAILSFGLLNKTLTVIPLGTAYAIWTGMGAFGTALVGILFFKESSDFWRIFFLFTLIASIIGLKVVSVGTAAQDS